MGAFDDINVAQPTPAQPAKAGAFDDIRATGAIIAAPAASAPVNSNPFDSLDAFANTMAQNIGTHDYNLLTAAQKVNSMLPSWLGGSSVATQQAATAQSQADNPTATTGGQIAGVVGSAVVGGGTAKLAATAAGLGTAGASLVGSAGAGAAAMPDHPGWGVAAGLSGDLVLGTAARLGGAVISKLPPSVVSAAKDSIMEALPAPMQTIVKNAGKFPDVMEALKEHVGNLMQVKTGAEVMRKASDKLSGSSDKSSGGVTHALLESADDVAATAAKE